MSKYLKLSASAIIASLFISVSGSAIADGAAVYTAKACGSCHGATGAEPIMGAYPKLAGQNAEYLVQQMIDFKSGARTNAQSAVMKGMVASVSEGEMKEIADYLASVK
jgi:cytochrome c